MAAVTRLSLSKLIFGALILVMQVWSSESAGRSLSKIESSMVERHEEWMTQFQRSYKDATEKAERLKIFKENANFIDTFNAAANRSSTLAINHFADLTKQEFLSTRTGFKMGSHRNNVNSSSSFMYADVADDDVPPPSTGEPTAPSLMLRIRAIAVRCCWAFAAVAATEGINQISGGKLVSLSEQELVDCERGESLGCGGGDPNSAFDYIVRNNGLSTEADYPYEAVDGTCNSDRDTSGKVGKISGYENVPAYDESALLRAVANQPVAIGIDAHGQDFRFYHSGVFTGECGTQLNHAVTIVGYGETSDGIKYWLAKNSWGDDWGENGYMKIQRDSGTMEGLCGITMHASYPTL